MKRTILLTTLALSSLGMAQDAYENLDNTQEPWQSGARTGRFFIGAGYGFASDGAASINDTSIDAINVDELISIEFGYKQSFNALTVSYSAELIFGEGSDSGIDSFGDNVSYESQNVGFLANIKFGYDFSQYFSAYIGGGIGSLRNEFDYFDSSLGSSYFEESLFIYQATAGVEFKPVEQLAIYVEYNYLSGEDFDNEDFTAIEDSFVDVGARFYF